MLSVLVVVAAVFAVIAIGYAAGRTGYLSTDAARGIADFAFRIAIPALLFHTVVTAKFEGVAPLGVIASFFGAVAAVWAITTALAFAIGRPAADHPSLAISATFGNTVMLGLPIGASTLGQEALAPISAIIACHSPILLLTATLHAAGVGNHGADGARPTVREAITSVLRQLAAQPLVIAIFAAVMWRLSGLPLPTPVLMTAEMLARAGVPAALISLGLSLATFKITGDARTVSLLLVLKLVLMPAIAAGLAFALALPPLSFAVVVMMAALPAGANAYLFSSHTGHAVNVASGAVAIGTAVSAVTLSLILLALKSS
jgi:predicted permease